MQYFRGWQPQLVCRWLETARFQRHFITEAITTASAAPFLTAWRSDLGTGRCVQLSSMGLPWTQGRKKGGRREELQK